MIRTLAVVSLVTGLMACQPKSTAEEPKKEAPAAKQETAKPEPAKESPAKEDPSKTEAAKPEVKQEDVKKPEAPADPKAEVPAKPEEPKVAPASTYNSLDRATFNRLAVRGNLPLYWTQDTNKNNAVDPDEVVTLRFYRTATAWTQENAFTPEFAEAYKKLLDLQANPIPASVTPEEAKRLELVNKELDQGKAVLVYNDFSALGEAERIFVGHMVQVADLVDQIYSIQMGAEPLKDKVPAECTACQSLFRRNVGPKCLGPETENEAACSAIPGAPKPTVDPYPAALQADPGFCEKLEKAANAKEVFAPFTVARANKDDPNGPLTVLGLPEAYPELMKAVADELKAAATVIGPANEEALAIYLNAAAQSFTDNNWEPADEAWTKMNARNSKWYVRVAPDEVYWEPCSRKAGMHLTFARINMDSLIWQDKLAPVQQDMEDTLAKLIGAPYVARKVTFHLPDFIDIVLNAGDDRDPFGATIGQSLPNWGPVANEGRGRTVVMSNLYTDPDSKAQRRTQAESLVDTAALADYPTSEGPGLLSIILHEAAHNLGPAHEYKVDGKTDDEVFGGPMASTMEELKSQTAALWYIDFLLRKGLITPELARQSYVDSFLWALGHISRGMYSEGKPKPYSQLAAIQVGFLMEAGAITYNPEAMAANGTDRGAFVLHLDQWADAVNMLMETVGQVKAQGNKTLADEMITKYVDGSVVPMQIIKERLLRYPKASFVYSLKQ